MENSLIALIRLVLSVDVLLSTVSDFSQCLSFGLRIYGILEKIQHSFDARNLAIRKESVLSTTRRCVIGSQYLRVW